VPVAFSVRPVSSNGLSDGGIVKLLGTARQSQTSVGSAAAKVTMTVYGDLECPICRAFVLGSGFSQLFARDVRSGKVRIVYRSFCTATCNGPGMAVFVRQQVAEYAAGGQHRFWQYAMFFLGDQGAEDSDYVNERFLDRSPGWCRVSTKRPGSERAITGISSRRLIRIKRPQSERESPARQRSSSMARAGKRSWFHQLSATRR
jgi:hypothetical protein